MKIKHQIDAVIATAFANIERRSLNLKNELLEPKSNGFVNSLASICEYLGCDSDEDVLDMIVHECMDYVAKLKPIIKEEFEALIMNLSRLTPHADRISTMMPEYRSPEYLALNTNLKFGVDFKKKLFNICDIEGKIEIIGSPILVYLTGKKMNMFSDCVKLGYVLFSMHNYKEKTKEIRTLYYNETQKKFIENTQQILDTIRISYYTFNEDYYYELVEDLYEKYFKLIPFIDVWTISCRLYDSLDHLNKNMGWPGYKNGDLDKDLIYFIAGRLCLLLPRFSATSQDSVAYDLWQHLKFQRLFNKIPLKISL